MYIGIYKLQNMNLEMFLKFLQYKICNITYGKKRVPGTVGIVARLCKFYFYSLSFLFLTYRTGTLETKV